MSTNIQVKRVCEYCGGTFMAKTTVTRFCSHQCNSRSYKLQQKQRKILISTEQTKSQQSMANTDDSIAKAKELVTVKELSILTSLSERTIFRLIKDDDFPKIKVGARLIFKKTDVVEYLNYKYNLS